ncbi:MAG: hypothetical protein DLM54_08080 [Acidimicrobiales bacterium]|nr:MAG: hypothetical protein DLM54_08080 [Acidimicrobiales bacterium]
MPSTSRGQRPSGISGRDANLGRATRVTGWAAAGSLALAGVFSAIAAHAFPGRAAASTTEASTSAGSIQSTTPTSAPSPTTTSPASSSPTTTDAGSSQAARAATAPLQAPSQVPVSTRRRPVAVSGGS